MTYYNIYLNDVLINEFPVQENYLDGLLGVCMRYNIGSCFRVSPVLKEPESIQLDQSVKDEPIKNADELLKEADWLLNLIMAQLELLKHQDFVRAEKILI